MPAWRPRRSSLALVLAVSALGAGSSAAMAVEPTTPSVRLLATRTEVTVTRWPGEGTHIDPGVFLTAVRGAFDIRAHRDDPTRPLEAWQVLPGGGARPIPSDLVTGLRGLRGFLRVRLTDRDGDLVHAWTRRFCPQDGDVRVNGNGPMTSRYPRVCYANPFSLGMVWGIEQGWGNPVFGWDTPPFEIGDGRYTMRISITRRWADLLGVDPSGRSVEVTVRVRTEDGTGCPDECPKPMPVDGGRDPDGSPRVPQRAPLGDAPTVAPPADAVPDLISLPAWNIFLERRNGRERITFAATVWNKGPAPLLVEGFRRQDEDVMDAYQYFLRGDDVLGRRRVGSMIFHRGRGHDHWHFLQFARYSLLDAEQSRAVISKKQSFCLAPTDAVDLTAPGAVWQPGSTGLETSCGGETATWIRETLHAGWGDTYFQAVAGQSFDVTDLPNGIYYVAVDANPAGLLYEADMSNNRELRKIRLGGSPGERTLTVYPRYGVDA